MSAQLHHLRRECALPPATDTCAHQYSYSLSYAHACLDFYSHWDGVCYTVSFLDGYLYTIPQPNGYFRFDEHRHPYADLHSHSAHVHVHANTYPDRISHAYAYADAHPGGVPHVHSNTNAHLHTYADAHSDRVSYTNADTNSHSNSLRWLALREEVQTICNAL